MSSADDGVEARALLDNGSTSSFVSERLVQSLRLPRFHHSVQISGIAGSSVNAASARSVASLQISSIYPGGKKLSISAIVLPHVTCDLPLAPVQSNLSWTHLSGLPLADPSFGEPRRVDILLGVDVFVDVLCQGQRAGPVGSPVAIETDFGWILYGGSLIT